MVHCIKRVIMTSLEWFLSNCMSQNIIGMLFPPFQGVSPCHMMHPEKVSSCILHGVCIQTI